MFSEKEYALKSCFATLPKTTRAMPLVLGGDPKLKNFLYCNGNSVIIRDIANPSICDVYTEHSQPTTVAKYSPSGFYIASGDQSGKMRIWDTTQKEHILKKEYIPLAGAIRDIAWSGDSQRLAVVGEGRERFGHVFLFDTGTSNGSLSGQSKTMNSVEFRSSRPFRIISASEDNTIAMFEGPPFKFKTSFQLHTRFAHSARYSPDGALFASCGADGKVFVFEGAEGTALGELVDATCKGNAHGGGIYGLSWSPDGRQLLTASGDKTCKVWDVESKSVLSTFTFGNQIDDQQLGCLWQGEYLLSVALSGFIYYLDPQNPQKPIRILKGHNRPITSVALSTDKKTIYSADSDGNIASWACSTGESDRIDPKFHKAQVQSMEMQARTLVTVSMDDTVAFATQQGEDSSRVIFDVEQCKLSSQPRGVGISPDGSIAVVAACKDVSVFRKHRQVSTMPAGFEATCVAIHPSNTVVAVGGQDSKVRVYNVVAGDALQLVKELSLHSQITDVKFSPDGKHLAACDASRRVVPYSVPDYNNVAEKEWTFHTARVNCIAWCPDNHRLATGSLDTNIIVWDLLKSGEHPIIIKGAHAMSQITGVMWIDNNSLVSTGQDSNVKQWTIY